MLRLVGLFEYFGWWDCVFEYLVLADCLKGGEWLDHKNVNAPPVGGAYYFRWSC